MTSIDGYQKFLEAFSYAHVNDGFMDDDGGRMLGYCMKLKGSPLLEVRELKDRGNVFFRQNNFDMTAACYDEACKLLGLSFGVVGGEDVQTVSELAVSLNSNLAACALKLEEFKATLDLCSMILNYFPRNVKARFRRALAFMKLKRFLEAKLDLVEALVVEPKNKDVLRELGVVENHLLIKENGKRVLETTPALDGDKNKKFVQVPEIIRSIKDSEEVKMEVTDAHNNHILQMDKSVKVEDEESVAIVMTDAQNNGARELGTSFKKNEHVFDKSSMLQFSRRGGGKFRLRIPGQAYQKLIEGKNVSFYYKRDLSTITIRILNKELIKGKATTRVMCQKKKRRRPRKRKSKEMIVMNENLSPLDTKNVKPLDCDTSSRTSSVCDNFPLPGTQSLQVSKDSSSPKSSVVTEDATSNCTQVQYDSNDHRPFLFSARPKERKMYSSSVSKLLCAPSMSRCKYPYKCHAKEKRRILISKKNCSQGGESPRHNLSTFSTSRSFTHKFLRPRGVSVSCCRYSSKAQLIKKRKEMLAHLDSSDRPLKKPPFIISPIRSSISFSNNVIIKSDSESQICTM